MHDCIFTLPNGRFLVVPSNLIRTLEQYRQLQPSSKEQGGMLLGVFRADDEEQFFLENPPCIEVLSITEPCDQDHATRFRFVRQCEHHLNKMKKAAQMYKELVYIGEWHTHPEDNPSPSTIDLNSWQKTFKNKIAIVVIIGRVTNWWGLWMGDNIVQIKNLQ